MGETQMRDPDLLDEVYNSIFKQLDGDTKSRQKMNNHEVQSEHFASAKAFGQIKEKGGLLSPVPSDLNHSKQMSQDIKSLKNSLMVNQSYLNIPSYEPCMI